MRFQALGLFPLFLLAGCTVPRASEQPVASAAASVAALPTGAELSPSGFLTVTEAPPSPFPLEPPPEPGPVDDFARRTSSPDPKVRERAWEEANGSAAFQAEIQRLQLLLRRDQPDNFVAVRIVRDPAVAAEIWFKRDAARTLARYTSNPQFRPREGGLNPAEVERLQALWSSRATSGRLINMFGVDPISGRVELGVAVEEAEFRREAARLGWTLGPELVLVFPQARPAAFATPGLDRHLRAFARETGEKGIQLTALLTGRIVLEDGCFRLAARDGSRGPLVLFGRNTQLALDAQGYLVVRGRDESRQARIGEMAGWGGPNHVDEEEPAVRALRQACGGGAITNVAEPQSERLIGLPNPQWVADYARARSISYRAAWRQVIDCMAREERRGHRGLDARDRCIRQFN